MPLPRVRVLQKIAVGEDFRSDFRTPPFLIVDALVSAISR
jgi:hypothetical protein